MNSDVYELVWRTQTSSQPTNRPDDLEPTSFLGGGTGILGLSGKAEVLASLANRVAVAKSLRPFSVLGFSCVIIVNNARSFFWLGSPCSEEAFVLSYYTFRVTSVTTRIDFIPARHFGGSCWLLRNSRLVLIGLCPLEFQHP